MDWNIDVEAFNVSLVTIVNIHMTLSQDMVRNKNAICWNSVASGCPFSELYATDWHDIYLMY